MTRLISLGRGGLLDADRIVAVARARSAPVKRLLDAAGPERVLSLTYGEPRESVLLLENGFLAVTALTPQALLALIKEVTDGR